MENVKPYYPCVEEFMKACENLNVTSMVLAALTDGTDKDSTHNVVSGYNAGPFELGSVAGIIQVHAGFAYTKSNKEWLEDEEQCEHD